MFQLIFFAQTNAWIYAGQQLQPSMVDVKFLIYFTLWSTITIYLSSPPITAPLVSFSCGFGAQVILIYDQLPCAQLDCT